MSQHQNLIDRDRKVTFHASTHLRDFAHGEAPGRVMAGGEGIHVVDKDGREFIDGFAGLYCVNIGYGRTEVAEAIHRQALELAYYHTYVAIRTSRRSSFREDPRAGGPRDVQGLLRDVGE